MKMRLLICLLLAALLVTVPVVCAEEAPVQIHTVEDLLAMGDAPSATYILMEDLDLAGVEWIPLDFSGTFDGNGHALLNLTLCQPGSMKPDSYDGNRKSYETAYVGLFGTVINGQISDLKLINVRGVVESDEPCFLAGIAGYAENTTISGCTVTGCLELRAHDRMFGVGGIVGYGSGYVENCQVDVTLLTVDTDASTKDEQFLGGIYGTGFMDVTDCRVVIDGYVSEHGYVHSGGVVGMYMDYPFGKTRQGCITGNDVKGKITFFEDNSSRRAYCKAVVGENLVDWFCIEDNTEGFIRDERTDYSRELRPEMCQEPVYTRTVVDSGCDSYGYTLYQCDSCGYSYRDEYTHLQHTVTKWTVVTAPTPEAEGMSQGNCDDCGILQTRTEPKAEPVETTETVPQTAAPTVPAETAPERQGGDAMLQILAACVAVLSLAALLLLRKLLRIRR